MKAAEPAFVVVCVSERGSGLPDAHGHGWSLSSGDSSRLFKRLNESAGEVLCPKHGKDGLACCHGGCGVHPVVCHALCNQLSLTGHLGWS